MVMEIFNLTLMCGEGHACMIGQDLTHVIRQRDNGGAVDRCVPKIEQTDISCFRYGLSFYLLEV